MLPALDLDDPAALSPLGGREETGRSAAQYLAAMREIFREMNDKIEQFGMRRLYYEIELPLERVLAEMENAGCAVAPDALRSANVWKRASAILWIRSIWMPARSST